MEGFNVWWLVEGKGEAPFSPFSFSPQQILLKFYFFPLILRFYFTMVLDQNLCLSFFFLDL
jgi:hypothetical protein